MKGLSFVALVLAFSVLGCGGPSGDEAQGGDSVAAHGSQDMPADDIRKGLEAGDSGEDSHSMGLNTAIQVAPEVASAWTAIRVRLVDNEAQSSHVYEVALGGTSVLGNSGLKVTAETFIPDFVMGEDGITSRSSEPANPAAQVVIREQGQPDFEGWLFAKMPEIHPYPHERYQVLLEDGVPAK